MGLGLLREGINEVIATTFQNAAPMGITVRDDVARMMVYRESHTAWRIEDKGWVVANFIFDPVLFVRTAFEDLPAEYFVSETVDGIPMQRLAETEAWSAFRTFIVRKTNEALVIRLELLEEEIIAPSVHPVNRGFNSVIEATVHATRFRMTGNPELRRWIDHHAGIIRKCGGNRELEAWGLLSSYLDDLKKD
jgi:hypothetical protein